MSGCETLVYLAEAASNARRRAGFNSGLPVFHAKSAHVAVNVMMRLSIKLSLLAVILLPNRLLMRDHPHASVGILFPVGEVSIDRKGLSQ